MEEAMDIGGIRQGVYGRSLYFPLKFAMNLKLLSKIKTIKFFKKNREEGNSFVP